MPDPTRGIRRSVCKLRGVKSLDNSCTGLTIVSTTYVSTIRNITVIMCLTHVM